MKKSATTKANPSGLIDARIKEWTTEGKTLSHARALIKQADLRCRGVEVGSFRFGLTMTICTGETYKSVVN